MLINLHVKNLALIDEADVFFDEGLNILTGETGAGKSILLGSINLALGAKASRDILGKHGDYASVELLFQVDASTVSALAAKDIFVTDNQVLISRKFTENRNIMKINGENVTLATVRDITSLLIDIHGQHEHQSLIYPANHLQILDRYARHELEVTMKEYSKAFEEYRTLEHRLSEFDMDEEQRKRNLDFLEYEINEIEAAAIHPGEDGSLEAEYRRAKNSRKIAEALAQAEKCVNSDDCDNATELIGRAYKAVSEVMQYDENMEGLASQLSDIESLISDFERELSVYMSGLEFDEEKYSQLEERLDVINNLKAKHGGSIESVLAALEAKKQKYDFLNEYEANRRLVLAELEKSHDKLVKTADNISKIRKEAAAGLEKEITQALMELNFLSVDFRIDFKPLEKPSANGMDHVEYLISVNPGEEPKPLAKVASGGELSRIMLAIKTVLADQDEIDTLIFDEIDTGISGRTAQMVANKLDQIAEKRQVICITHLPQIAAMAKKHFGIIKSIRDNKTVTNITELDYDGSVMELARMLGGDSITDTAVSNARELKRYTP